MPDTEKELELWRLRLVSRAVKLRRTRRIAPVWIDEDIVSIARSEFEVQVRDRISWEHFALLIADAEQRAENGANWNAELVPRKAAGSAGGEVLQDKEKIG